MRRYLGLLLGFLGAVLAVQPVEAKQLTLTPAASCRLVDPNDGTNIAMLYRFDLPDMANAKISRAFLTLPGVTDEEAIVAVLPAPGTWDGSTSWNGLRESLASTEESPLVASGDSEGASVKVSSLVKAWVSGSRANYGVVVGRVPGTRTDLSEVLPVSGAAPVLTLVYIRPAGTR